MYRSTSQVICKNRKTGEEKTYSGLEPCDALIVIYAQSIGDFNSAHYGKYCAYIRRDGVYKYELGDWYVATPT